MGLAELEKAEHDAERAARAVADERREFLSKRKEEAEKEADGLYGERLSAGLRAAAAARMATIAERERIALTGEGAPFPLGTKLCLWDHAKTPRWSPPGPLQVVATGVLEAITTTSEHPANLAHYSTAKVGQYVVRLHKKDGKLGARYDTNIRKSDWGMRQWLPEGQKPAPESA